MADTSVKVFEIVPPPVDTAMVKDQTGSKIAPAALVQEALQGVRQDRYEIYGGRAKSLIMMHRFFPAWVERMVRNE